MSLAVLLDVFVSSFFLSSTAVGIYVFWRRRGSSVKIWCAVDVLSRRIGRRVTEGKLCGCGMEVSFKVFYPPDRNAGPRG